MDYRELKSCSSEELKDLRDTLYMNKCRCMFPYNTHKQYYDNIDNDIDRISKILKSRNEE